MPKYEPINDGEVEAIQVSRDYKIDVKKGNWIVKYPDGSMEVLTDEVFKKKYKQKPEVTTTPIFPFEPIKPLPWRKTREVHPWEVDHIWQIPTPLYVKD
jgi:hypothetical protein